MRTPSHSLLLFAAGTMFLSACSTTPSIQQTVPRVPPTECLAECQTIPKPTNGSDESIRTWIYEVIDVAGECRRLHADCAAWTREGSK